MPTDPVPTDPATTDPATTDARPAVFLDRDGTVCREVDYLRTPDELELLPGAGEAVALLNRSGFCVVLVTNQSGVARGFLDEAQLARIHQRLAELLASDGARLDALYACPHHPEHGKPPYRRACACRKPRPGMLLAARDELGLDLGASWIVGDTLRDLEAGAALGVPGILVATGKGADVHAGLDEAQRADLRFLPDLLAAARSVVEATRPGQGR